MRKLIILLTAYLALVPIAQAQARPDPVPRPTLAKQVRTLQRQVNTQARQIKALTRRITSERARSDQIDSRQDNAIGGLANALNTNATTTNSNFQVTFAALDALHGFDAAQLEFDKAVTASIDQLFTNDSTPDGT